MRRLVTAVALAALVLAAAPARAHRAPERVAVGREAQSEFWREVMSPGARRAATLLRHGLGQIDALAGYRPEDQSGAAERRALLEGAMRRFQMAHRLTPDDPEVLYALAWTTAAWQRREPTGAVRRMDDEAMALYQRLRTEHPDHQAQEVSFELGVLYTRGGRFSEAAREYQRSIALAPMAADLTAALALNNLAEVTMLAGDVQQAVAHYERALAVGDAAGDRRELVLWGLAVALDRLGEHRSALERATEAFSAGGNTTASLHGSGVFFEPAYEIHWYEALGHEAHAAVRDDAAGREASLRQAHRSFRRYLHEGGDESRWADIARGHLTRLEAELPRASDAGRRPPGQSPRPGWQGPRTRRR